MTDSSTYDLERKFCSSETALTISDGRVIEGYASRFGLVDRGGDIVVKGAYASSLARMRAKKTRVKMLWQHDPSQPIGIWDEVREDENGLYVKGRLLLELERGREAAHMIDAGIIDGLSIGYRTIRSKRDSDGARRLSEVELWEVSLVTFPMLAEARVAAKSEVSTDILGEVAALFREAGLALGRL